MADRDPDIQLGHLTERAQEYVSRGLFDSLDEVVAAALDALDKDERTLEDMLRIKLAEALADPRPAIPMDEAFRRLDEMKAARRRA